MADRGEAQESGHETREELEHNDPLRFALREIHYLVRAVDGEPRQGVAGLKDQLAEVQVVDLPALREGLEAVQDGLEKAAEERAELRQQQQVEEARNEGRKDSLRILWGVVSFLGSGVVIGAIAWLYNAITGGG